MYPFKIIGIEMEQFGQWIASWELFIHVKKFNISKTGSMFALDRYIQYIVFVFRSECMLSRIYFVDIYWWKRN